MLQHIVMLNLQAEHDPAELAEVMAGLAALSLDGFMDFRHGPNLDFEKKSAAYDYGFICSFADEAALHRYARDAGHQVLGARLVAQCQGGGDGIFVVDLKV